MGESFLFQKILNGAKYINYINWAVQDENDAKYEVYNGYDFASNPTPNLSNLPFNQWILNNSLNQTTVLNNVILTQSSNATFVDNSVGINVAFMPFVNNSANYGGLIVSVTTNNGFIYVGGFTDNTVQKFHEDNLAFVGNTVSYNLGIETIAVNNGFIYVGGGGIISNATVRKYNESDLTFIDQTNSYGGPIRSVTINNGFIYVVGSSIQNSVANARVQKFNESDLTFVANTVNYGGTMESVKTNNGFIYVGGRTNQTVKKFYEQTDNLVNTPVYSITDVKE